MAKPPALPSLSGGVEHSAFGDIADLRRFVQSFIDLWDEHQGNTVDLHVEHAESGVAIWSLANHSVELSRTVLLLSEQDRMIIAVPLIRLLLENMITAAWLYVSPEAARALVHEGLRNRVAAIREVVQRDIAGFTPDLLDEWKAQLDGFSGEDTAEGRHFEKRCRTLVDGPSVYTTWRVASALSHAGTTLSDFYLVAVEKTDQNPIGIAVNRASILPFHEAWLGTTAWALIGSMKAFDLASAEHPFSAEIADGAARMGINLEFQLIAEGTVTHT